ncbi:anti-sigma factor [Aliikangiella sp. G2MR2-5]|uniref:anti-sigma factor family protein n=1 Tax=Aliikangiella sp. G2MR2-5 TaxID=2788943 RepID=UPI0018A93315|nr:zf-HC2 domain-containing protein [Aliikangiella sp. G2MR2-5]
MHCNHQIVTEHLTDYIEGRLSPAVKKQLEETLNNCESCAQVYQNALALEQAAHQWQEQVVPDWHRTEYAVRPKPKVSNWLSWGALATSTLAIFMVIFQVQIESTESGFNVAFGGASEQKVNRLVEKRLAAYQKQQSVLLDARLIEQEQKLSDANKIALASFLEKTREERRDDLNFLVTGIQSQRMADRQKVERQITALADNQIENNQYINQLIQSANLTEGDK